MPIRLYRPTVLPSRLTALDHAFASLPSPYQALASSPHLLPLPDGPPTLPRRLQTWGKSMLSMSPYGFATSVSAVSLFYLRFSFGRFAWRHQTQRIVGSGSPVAAEVLPATTDIDDTRLHSLGTRTPTQCILLLLLA
ncbi:hypothetical protein BP5796_06732 [Coleophoma crateriformis]|uniref:Uncharacterized protein n=1 Tax=Coleophoma crateriformis TaxID=565419 RepID=A0A3D8RQ29_9HELO|nr:hypothetical protein BP5796_06732 [Coleophoma crateriformis]